MGTLNPLDSEVRLPGFSQPISQRCFVDSSGGFLEEGDSGAWMINMEGKAGALIFACNGLQQAYGTDMSVIFSDIEEQLNCKVEFPDVGI